jgi:hypothetical protein
VAARADWLAQQRTADRAEALAAIEALPDPARFEAASSRRPEDDVVPPLAAYGSSSRAARTIAPWPWSTTSCGASRPPPR